MFILKVIKLVIRLTARCKWTQ